MLNITVSSILSGIIHSGLSLRGGTKCDCKRDKLWVRFPLERMKYLIFSFLRSSMRSSMLSSGALRKNEDGMSLDYVPSAYTAMWRIQRDAKKKITNRLYIEILTKKKY